MLIATEAIQRRLQAAITNCAVELVDVNGDPVVLNTIDELRLRTAAMVALQIAAGETVWPANQKIPRPKPRPSSSVFEE